MMSLTNFKGNFGKIIQLANDLMLLTKLTNIFEGCEVVKRV